MKRIVSGAVSLIILTTAVLIIPLSVKAPVSDTLIVGVQNDTPNLSPWDIWTNTVWKHRIWRQWVFESLFGVLPNGTLYPVLATDYAIDPLIPGQVGVGIKQGVTFTDGIQMNATDVVFSFQTMAFNGQLSNPVMKSIVWPNAIWPRWNASTSVWGAANPSHVGVTRFDDYSVVFHLRQNYSMFTFGTLTSPITPAHIWMSHLVPVSLSDYVLPDGSALSGATEFDFDRNFGRSDLDTQATVGTGPWRLVQWMPFVRTNLEVYTDYWGKALGVNWDGRFWPFYPRNVTRMQFNVYGSLDVAILALKAGEVHIVPWNLPIGFYDDLKRDQRMGFKISTQDGFNYLAFNMRREPFNDLQFRKAMSFAIDKDFIVDRLLGGFGFKGQTPVSLINPKYINSSATTPPFDLNQARSILDAAGYRDINGDGWRDLPDGRPMKYNILTPAKDYDPIGTDSGILIANNLKLIGLNIDSSPTAFDAIVSAAFVAASFDMYMLSWDNLGLFPELYFENMFGCSEMVESGLGDNTPGYCSVNFESLADMFDSEMNDPMRIQVVKDAQGLLSYDLPYNSLYIARRIIGYRNDIWTGWEDVFNDTFNWWSVNIIGPGQPPPPSGPETALVIGNPSYASTYMTSSTPLSFNVIDWNGSGINWTVYGIDIGFWIQYVGPFFIAGEGSHYLEFYSEDMAGNTETAKSRTIVVDDSPPVTTIQPPSGNYTTEKDFTFTAIDAHCGVNLTQYRVNGGDWDVYLGPFNLDPPGQYTIDYYSVDNLGWIESVKSANYTIFPAVPPITSLFIGNPNYTLTITYVKSLTPLSLSVVDRSGAGIKTTLIKVDGASWRNYTGQFSLSSSGEHRLEWYSTDNVGNIESVNTRTLRVDDSPPTTSLSMGTPSYTAAMTYVNSSTPMILTAIDGGATPVGIAVTRFRVWGGVWSEWGNYTSEFELTGRDGTFYLECYSVDHLGNAEATRNSTITLDNAAPELALQRSAGELTVETAFGLTAVDSGSGLKLIEYSIDDGGWFEYAGDFKLPEGTHTIHSRASDNLGNTAEISEQVTVRPKSDIVAIMVLMWPIFLLVAVIIIVILWVLRRQKGQNRAGAPPAVADRREDEGK